MLQLNIFINAFIIGLSGAMMPGPLLTQNINRSARRGLSAASLIVLGHAILELAVVVGLLYGLDKLITRPTVSGYIGIIGGAVLIWMGFDIIKSTWQGKITLNGEINKAAEQEQQSAPLGNPIGDVLTGMVVSASNPYFLMWWATVGLALFNNSIKSLGKGGPLVFYSGHILADLAWYVLIGVIVVKGKNFIPEKVFRGILIFCGIFLVGYSVKFIIYGFNSLF